MYSSKDFQKFWFLYQTEGAPNGISMQVFANNVGIPYEEFYAWYRKTHKAISPVKIEGLPQSEQHSDNSEQPDMADDKPQSAIITQPRSVGNKGGILVTIQTREGLHIRKGGLTYIDLKLLIERLEGLC